MPLDSTQALDLGRGSITSPLFGSDHEPQLLAWMAGFFDGEGCITTPVGVDTKWARVIHLELTQNDPTPLHIFKERFGGSVNSISTRRASRWQLGRISGVKRTLWELLPYFVVKREQARLALEFLDLPPAASRRNTIALELRRLKDIRPIGSN